MEAIKKIIEKIKVNKKLRYGLVILLILIVLLIYFSTFLNSGDDENPSTTETKAEYTQQTKIQLEYTLSKIKGVGKVSAMINFESTPEILIAYITSVSGNNSTTSPQIITSQGTQLPVVLKTVFPRALGAVVVAEGAGDTKVRLRIQEAVVTALGIPTSAVNVFPM